MNRVQPQPGLSMPEFLQRSGTEAQSDAAVEAARWPRLLVRPGFGAGARTSFVREHLRCWQRADRAHQCRLSSGTVFESTKLPVTIRFLAVQRVTQARTTSPRWSSGASLGSATAPPG